MSLTATRLTDAANTISADTGQPLRSCQVEYSTCSPFNSDNTLLLVLEDSYFALWDMQMRARLHPLLTIDASSEPRWSRWDANAFYYHKGNCLYRYRVNPGLPEAVHCFNEYAVIGARGESEMAELGDSLVLVGDDRELFVYDIHTLTKSPVLTIPAGPWDSACLAPNGDVILSQGSVELYSRGMQHLRRLAAANGHKHVARSADGSECLLWDNSNEPSPRGFDQHAIVKIDLATGTQSLVMELGWQWATHITAPMGVHGWCIIATYDNGTEGELFGAWLDGRPAQPLLRHGSNSSTYEGQPHQSVSRNGRWLAYNSNVGGRTDVYLLDLSPTLPSPPDYSGENDFPWRVKARKRWWQRVLEALGIR